MIGRGIHGELAAIAETVLATLLGIPLFGSDEDYAVSSPVSVYGTGSRIFKHGDAGDIIRVYIPDRTLESVHYDQRRRVIERADTADTDGDTLAARLEAVWRTITPAFNPDRAAAAVVIGLEAATSL